METGIKDKVGSCHKHSVYRGYLIMKSDVVPQGGEGMWIVPHIKHREFGNKIVTGFDSISLRNAREMIDSWFDFNEMLRGK